MCAWSGSWMADGCGRRAAVAGCSLTGVVCGSERLALTASGSVGNESHFVWSRQAVQPKPWIDSACRAFNQSICPHGNWLLNRAPQASLTSFMPIIIGTCPLPFVVRRHPSLTAYIYTIPIPDPTHRMAATNISKKRKFVADGVFYAELNEVRASSCWDVCGDGCTSRPT